MALDLSAVRAAMATALDAITGLRASDVQPERLHPPHAWVDLPSGTWEYDADFAGGFRCPFTVTLVLGRADQARSLDALDAYINPTGTASVKAVLEASSGVLGTCDDIVVQGGSGLVSIELGGQSYIGAVFGGEVIG